MNTHMQFCVLGPLIVAGEEGRAALASDRQRTILATLLSHRDAPVSTERLVDAVWGEQPPPSAHKSLHSHISRLRRTLMAPEGDDADARDPLVTEELGYRIDLEHHDLDADEFERLVARARRDLAADPERAVSRFEEALALWRGPAFGDLAAHEVVRPTARYLEELRVAAEAERVDAMLALGAHDAVIGVAQATIAAAPLDERPHRQLILALYRAGRQADALATYRGLERRLVEELGVDPSPELQRLYEQILHQDPELAAPSPPRRARLTLPREPALEGASTSEAVGTAPRLIGRDADVAAVETLVLTESLVTLTGPGGVGKTRLAREVTTRVADHFADGVLECRITSLGAPADLASALIGSWGVQPSGGRRPENALLEALGTRRVLLVLDGCEHLLAEVAELTERIRARCPNVAILTTTREPLHLSDERVWTVEPLPVPDAGADVDDLAEVPAVALFCARAHAVDPTFALTPGNGAAVVEICRRLDGMPLAIELAAGRARAMTPSEIADRIEDRFRLLTGGPRHDAGRHRTLEAVVSGSYEMLTGPEARLFDRLSVFQGSFPLVAAERVCSGDVVAADAVAGLLAELVDKSLVVAEPGHDQVRYRLLDTLRHYGAMRLEESGTSENFRRTHALSHVQAVEKLAPRVRGANESAAVAEIDAAIDDLRAAHAWFAETDYVDGALRLVVAVHDYFHYRLRDEIAGWAERALELPGARSHPASPGALATAARGAMNRGELERAQRHAEVALAHAERRSLASLWATHVLNEVAMYQGRFDDALVLAQRRADLAVETGWDYYRALADVSRALGHLYRGDVAEATSCAADAVAAADACGNLTALAWARYAAGEALLDVDAARAIDMLEDAVDAARRIGNRLAEGVALVSLASVLGRSGSTDRALRLFREVVAHWRDLGDHTHQVTTLRNLAELLARVRADEPTAVLFGAVAGGSAPSFGPEARRLGTAWDHLRAELGRDRADAAAAQGRQLTPAEVVDEVLTHLDEALAA